MIPLSGVGNRVNRLVKSIADLCRDHPVREKWLLVSAYRTGYQWLENVALSGVPVFNLRLFTFRSLALRLATRVMEDRGQGYVQGLEYELLVADVLRSALSGEGHLPRGSLDPDLVKAVSGTLADLRAAGLEAGDLHPRAFTPPEKGREIASLLSGVEERLRRRRLADHAEALKAACRALEEGEAPVPAGLLVAMPADMLPGLSRLERELWDALPASQKVILEVDRVDGSGTGPENDAALLGWLSRPYEAPAPHGDGSARIFRAVGETNEVREVLRCCLGEGIPADRVEILHTDYHTYVPRLFQLCRLLFPEDADGPPVTFAEGIPLWLTRPGRAMLGWISWIREDLSLPRLAELVQDGLLSVSRGDGEEGSFSRLAASLRALPVWRGREGYEGAFRSLEREPRPTPEADPDDGEGPRRSTLRPGQDELEALHELCADLLSGVPADPSDVPGLLKGAEDFLARRVRALDRADQYALHLLLQRVREFRRFSEASGAEAFPALDWLEETVRSSRVLGEGPRPGRLHVAPLGSGGASGRPVVFVLGLDDGRFPGPGMQDPLLLDSERKRISSDLATSSARTAAALEELSSLFARLRGRVTLSYSSYAVSEDREMYPSPALVTAHRLLSGSASATLEDLLRHLPDPASFAAHRPENALLPCERWLSLLGSRRLSPFPESVLSAHYPHLERGLRAARERGSDRFTEYDGYVPEAGLDLDPAAVGGPVVSPRRLEIYGKCPMEYFFRFVLGIEPLEEFDRLPVAWLSSLERGQLLHSVFRRFHQEAAASGRPPSMQEDWQMMEDILRDEISAWRRVKPPPSPQVLEEEAEELFRTARIFLQEEESCCREREPAYLEVAVGVEKTGAGNPVDLEEPLELTLPDGKRIVVRGRIDRIDRVKASSGDAFLVCDYKTGSADAYDPADPFKGGRCVQNYLYRLMAESCLRRVHPEAEVAGFEYFFPGTRAHGERICWEAGILAEGQRVVHDICLSIAAGCFPASDEAKDMEYSDFLLALWDIEEAAASTRRKMENEANRALEHFRRLRGGKEVKG